MNKTLEMLYKLMEILGNVTLKDAAAWAEVEANAQKLRDEGHEEETEQK